MKNYAFRLNPGKEIKTEIKQFVIDKNINAGIILSCVGSLNFLEIRLADGKSTKTLNEDLEIISLQGTLGKDKCHIHISASDNKGNVYGGHLKKAIINTTAEIVITNLDNYTFSREFDEQTGFKELIIK